VGILLGSEAELACLVEECPLVRLGAQPPAAAVAQHSIEGIEFDGPRHLLDPVAYRRDRRKDTLLQEQGYFVLRPAGSK
jgi:hypothetical protein